jgi:hypothetical protein
MEINLSIKYDEDGSLEVMFTYEGVDYCLYNIPQGPRGIEEILGELRTILKSNL